MFDVADFVAVWWKKALENELHNLVPDGVRMGCEWDKMRFWGGFFGVFGVWMSGCCNGVAMAFLL